MQANRQCADRNRDCFALYNCTCFLLRHAVHVDYLYLIILIIGQYIFYPFSIETAGTWHEMAIELTQEIGRRITTIEFGWRRGVVVSGVRQ